MISGGKWGSGMPIAQQSSQEESQQPPGQHWWGKMDKGLLALLCVYGLLWIPLIPRSTANPQMLAACINDEPLISLQLVGMRFPPYGNPANLLKHPERSPREWGFLTYPGIMYY